MELTLKHYDTTVSVKRDNDDISIDEMANMVRELMLAAGYHPDNVKEYFPSDNDFVDKILEEEKEGE